MSQTLTDFQRFSFYWKLMKILKIDGYNYTRCIHPYDAPALEPLSVNDTFSLLCGGGNARLDADDMFKEETHELHKL